MAADTLLCIIRRIPVLSLLLVTAACGSDGGMVGRGLSSGWDTVMSPFTGPRNSVASDSLTAQRVRGGNPAVEPLQPEAGNVWPAQESPRPTLMGGPDEAMRNIPSYRPSLIEGAPPARSPVASPGDMPAPRRRGSSTPPQALGDPAPFPRGPAAEPFTPVTPPPRRLEGRALITPSDRIVTGTGGTERVQGFTSPQGGGAVVRDGNVETWIGPNGQASTRIVPLN